MKKNILLVASLLLIAGVFYEYNPSYGIAKEVYSEGTLSVATRKIGLQEGNRAPDFTLQTLDGEKVKLSNMLGKIVFLNFWTTWCPPCKAEMPDLQEFYEEQQDNNIEIVAVNITTSEKKADDVGVFAKEYGLTFPVLLDNKGDVADTYRILTIPTTYVIDKHGIVRKKIIGPLDKKQMVELIGGLD